MSETKTETATRHVIELEVEIDAGSAVVGCSIGMHVIQTAEDHRFCGQCGQAICATCVSRLTEDKCPKCRSTAPFSRRGHIAEFVYKRFAVACPNAGCSARVISLADHVPVCKQRLVPCMFCTQPYPAQDVHVHLLQCVVTWKKYEVAVIGDLMKDLVADDGAQLVGGYIRMSPETNVSSHSGPPGVSAASRMLYVWREGVVVRLMCIQLASSGDEKVVCIMKSTGDDDVMRKLPVKVSGIEDIHRPAIVEINATELANYNTFEFGPGLHMMSVGTTYRIDVDEHGDRSRATLIEVLAEPSRGVFVTEDDRRKTVVIALDGATIEKRIRLPGPDSSSDDSELPPGLRDAFMAALVQTIMSGDGPIMIGGRRRRGP